MYQQKREELLPEEVEELSRQICQQLLHSFPLQEVKHLHVFLPIARQKEVNTWLIIQQIREQYPQLGIVVSRTEWKSRRMENYHLLPGTSIRESSLGIPEPVEANFCPAEKIDMVLLPLLAFDLEGNRVGYGAGFYDRFLTECSRDAQKVGLSFFGPLPKKIPDVHPHDIPMDACVCPDKVYYFNSAISTKTI